MLDTPELREQLYRYIEQLSPDRLAVALDFVSYLVERDDHDATSELLTIPGFTTELNAAEREAEAEELMDWRPLRMKGSS